VRFQIVVVRKHNNLRNPRLVNASFARAHASESVQEMKTTRNFANVVTYTAGHDISVQSTVGIEQEYKVYVVLIFRRILVADLHRCDCLDEDLEG
jgi:hypothetical protein